VSEPLTAIIEWFAREGRDVPWRASRDRYAIWVAEVMSAQTTLSRAVAAWEAWMTRWPDVDALAAATLADVLGQWQGLGYPRRARDLHRSAQLIAAHGWPEDLTALPGVGPYVSAAIRCFALEQPVLPRDVNVERVLRRRFPGGVEIADDPWSAGQALMELGQRICRTRPQCGICPAAAGCAGPDAVAEARARPRRQARFEGSLRQRRGRLLARVIAEGAVPRAEADPEAAAGLVLDALILADGELLRAPA
jgi:A/G-specific adenine glycosylase